MTGAAGSTATERRTGDLVRCIVGALGVAVAGLWAQSSTAIDTSLFTVVNGLPDSLEGLANALSALGTIWCVLVVVAVLLLARWFLAARDAAVAGVLAWLVAIGLNDLLGTRSAHDLGIVVRSGSGPEYPVATAAVVTALALALAPYLVRPLRRLSFALVVLVGLAAMYLGTGLASDVVGGILLGIAAGAAVHVAFGAPNGRPSPEQIEAALGELGLEVTGLEPSPLGFPGATIMLGTIGGEAVRVVTLGRDQRDGQLAARLWHNVMYKDPGLPVFGNRLQTVEHLAYAGMLAGRAGVVAPQVVKTGMAGQDLALLVTAPPAGRSFAEIGDALTDADIAAGWRALDRLHAAGITHGAIGPAHLLVGGDGEVAFADLGAAEVTNDEYRRNRDVAALLVTTSLLADPPVVADDPDDDGPDVTLEDAPDSAPSAAPPTRAVAAGIAALGRERISAAVPLVQPAALPSGAGSGTKHLGKVLKRLRQNAAAASGTEEAAPLKIKRLSLVNIGMLAGVLVALAIAIPSLTNVDWSSVQGEFEHAIWGWAVLALVLYPLVPSAWATALLGCVNADLPFVPTVLTQLACSFLNLITPNGIGGTGLQLDYLHKEGVPVASGASAMVLSTGVGGAIQMVLFLVAAAITSTKVDTSGNSGSVSLGAIAVVAALIGIVLAIPKVRGKVVPAVKRAANDIWAVLRNPKKAMQLVGGDLAGNLVYPFLLGLCLMAFGAHLSFAQLVVVQIGAGMLGNVAPVPGGIGVTEAALTAGLTAFGIDSNTALATVLLFRGITFALPPVFGFFTLRYLRSRGYA